MSHQAPGVVPSDQAGPSNLASNISPVEAALQAAEQRRLAALAQQSAISSPSSAHARFDPESFNPSAADKLVFFRLLDSEILPNCSTPQRVKTLEMLSTILSNILNPPVPEQAPKYRQIRLTNTAITRNIVDVPGAQDYLIACAFRKSITEFVPYLTFNSSPTPKQLHSLRTGHHVLQILVKRAQEQAEREARSRDSEKGVEQQRKEKAMLAFAEDRRLKREKDERDKLVRDARAQKAHDDALLLADHPVLYGDASTSSMDVDPRHDELPPPSYGALHGHVLGTGEAVSQAEFHAPDFLGGEMEEEEENED